MWIVSNPEPRPVPVAALPEPVVVVAEPATQASSYQTSSYQYTYDNTITVEYCGVPEVKCNEQMIRTCLPTYKDARGNLIYQGNDVRILKRLGLLNIK